MHAIAHDNQPLAAECRHFVDCIETGKEPINGGKIGVEVVRLLEMISQAGGNL